MPSIPIVIDTNFAENLNSTGNRCSITFSPPLQVPRDADPELRLYSSSFSYNFANVDTANNKLKITSLSTPNIDHEFTFPTGLYSLSDIAQTIKFALSEVAAFNVLSFNLLGISSTQKVHIEVTNSSAVAYRLDFSDANSIGSLLGFTSNKIFNANGTTTRESDTVAALDSTTSVLFKTSLCNGSVVHGQGGSNTLAMIHLAAATPASVFAYQPNPPLSVPAEGLAGTMVTSATFAIVNQNGDDLNTLGEKWQAVLEIVW